MNDLMTADTPVEGEPGVAEVAPQIENPAGDVLTGLESPQEKTIPQSKVEQLIKLNKNLGFEKGYKKAQSEYPSEQSDESLPGYTSNENIRGMIAEALTEHTQTQETQIRQEQEARAAQKIQEQLQEKIQAARIKHPDFDKVTEAVDFREFPEMLVYANEVPNTGDVILDLAKNPLKIGALRGLPPQAAIAELRKLSDSISQNEAGAQAKQPTAPLSPYSATNSTTGARTLGLADLKRKYKKF